KLIDVILYVVLLSLGLIASFQSGILGIGGAIINYILLLYIPPMIGPAEFTAQEVSSISMFQVFCGSLAGVIAYRQSQKKTGKSLIHRGLVLYMGSSILMGSFIGGLRSQYLFRFTNHHLYGILSIISVF